MNDSKPDAVQLLQRSLVEIKRLKAKLHDAPKRREPIAVVGMACRFPGRGLTLDGYWRDLLDVGDAIGEVPEGRWAADDPGRLVPGVRLGGWLAADVRDFDAAFFGLTEPEARALDPQQRLLLELTWEALEHAGIPPRSLEGSATSVHVGVTTSDYRERVRLGTHDLIAGAGAENGFAAGRIAHTLALRGPAIVLDAACASALVAIDAAGRLLGAREVDLALVGAANVILSSSMGRALAQAGLLSPDGRCHTFDARANGYVRAEGAGVLVLKRLSDAERDGDVIWGVVRGTAVNQNGRAANLIAPSGRAQVALLRSALASADLAPGAIDYLEAHGIGTAIGDPMELEAIHEVFGGPRANGAPCLVGSVKSSLGHLEAASGMAGIFKLLLALDRETIPAMRLGTVSPRLPPSTDSVRIAQASRPWTRGERPRIAGVSAFGMSGTNAHVIVAEPPARIAPPPANAERTEHVLVLSAETERALRAQAAAFAAFLGSPGAPAIGDVCHTAALGRTHLGERLAVTGASGEAIATSLAGFARGEEDPNVRGRDDGDGDGAAERFVRAGEIDPAIVAGRKVPIPTYPFQRRRYWLDPSGGVAPSPEGEEASR